MIPVVELAVSLNEVKAFLRIDGGEEDALLAGFVRTAMSLCEAFTGQRLIASGHDEIVRGDGAWHRLKATPVRVMQGAVRLSDSGEIPITVESQIDDCGDMWVRADAAGDRVRVTVEAGMAADWNGLPEALRQGIVRLVAHLFAHRDADDDAGPPAAVAALWRPWRRMRLS